MFSERLIGDLPADLMQPFPFLLAVRDQRRAGRPGCEMPPVGQRAVAVADGVKAKVLWVSSNPVQPALGYYVVLNASEREGVHVGDQFTLLRPRLRDELTGLWLPEQDIATTQVVRVGAHSATAVVIAQTMPAIMAGADARLTAKMP